MRDELIRDSLGVDIDAVWDAVKKEINKVLSRNKTLSGGQLEQNHIAENPKRNARYVK